jgi:anaerobic magnesium-protoporphyrin IX monomethyl ester cyclase
VRQQPVLGLAIFSGKHMARILLITPSRRFISNRFGLGYQIPLGLVCIGGSLLDAGHSVRLIDNDLHGWPVPKLMQEIADFNPGYMLVGHTGSTAAHPIAIQTIKGIRRSFPNARIVYGGVYPSYADRAILTEFPEIDVIVRGEGEQIMVDLIDAWENSLGLETVLGITWRNGDEVIVNRSRPPIQNLSDYRFGWELVDWPRYKMFGFAPVAGLQFSRGCPLTCTYCGQWMFWKKWRHRSPENIVENLRLLVEKYGVQFVWFADENFSADKELTKALFKKIIDAKLDLSMNLNMTAADIVRDADIMPLYKAAGIDYIVTGVEALEDGVIQNIRKNNPFSVSKEAMRILRENNIISLANIIYGLENESLQTVLRKFFRLLELDADILNAEYLTPHFWTADGKATRPEEIIQTDLSRWTYRNQVIATPYLSPLALFLAIKLTEFLYHLRPKALMRLFTVKDPRYRKIMWSSMWLGLGVVFAEIWEFFFETKFSARESLKYIPGSPAHLSELRKNIELPVIQM